MRISSHSVCVTIFALGICIGAAAQDQQMTLADRAKAARASKTTSPNVKVITNDSLGFEARPAPPPSEAAATTGAAAPEGSKDQAAGGAMSAEDIKKMAGEYAEKINKVKEDIAMLERETNVASREAQIRAAQFYGDAGARLQNEKQWLADQQKSQQETDAKKKALADAKTKLEQLRDEARRAGVPANQIP